MWKIAIVFLALVVPAGNVSALSVGEIQLTSSSGMFPSFSPDGTKIVYSSMGSGELDIWVMDKDSKNQVHLTSDIYRDEHPVFSPDGSKILYVSQRFERQNIWVMDADGSNKRQLSHSDMWESSPSWSPDGKRIAYVSAGPEGHEIKIMDADGENSRTLTADAYWKGQLSWGSDSKIAFVSRQSGDYDIWIMNADGVDVRRLTSNRFWQTSPSLGPRGDSIVYASDQSGTSEIWIMNLNFETAPELVEDVAVGTLPVPAVETSSLTESKSVSTAGERQLQREKQDYENLVIFVLPFIYLLMKRWRLKRAKWVSDGNCLS